MPLPPPEAVARRLLGRTPDRIEPLIVWDHRVTFRCAIGRDEFVCKTDEDRAELAKEAVGHERAAGVGIPVPELVAVDPDAIAMRWVEGPALDAGASPEAWRAAGRTLRRIHDLAPIGPFGGGFAPARDTWAESLHAEVDASVPLCVRDYGLDASQGDRIRHAVADARPALTSAPVCWLHGDLQPDHVILDRSLDDVAAIIDWSDHGRGDASWDVAVLTLENEPHLPELLDGYGHDANARARIEEMLPLCRVIRWLGEICWLFEHAQPAAYTAVANANAWRP